MTARPYSDATLDALAAAPPVPLSALIAWHRLAYRADLYIPKLATDAPPVLTDARTGQRSEDAMSMLGPTLSHALLSWVTIEERAERGERIEVRFPWARSRMAARDLCRGPPPP